MYRAKRQLCSNVLIVITWIPWRPDWLVVAVKVHYCNITIDSDRFVLLRQLNEPNKRSEQIELRRGDTWKQFCEIKRKLRIEKSIARLFSKQVELRKDCLAKNSHQTSRESGGPALLCFVSSFHEDGTHQAFPHPRRTISQQYKIPN